MDILFILLLIHCPIYLLLYLFIHLFKLGAGYQIKVFRLNFEPYCFTTLHRNDWIVVIQYETLYAIVVLFSHQTLKLKVRKNMTVLKNTYRDQQKLDPIITLTVLLGTYKTKM